MTGGSRRLCGRLLRPAIEAGSRRLCGQVPTDRLTEEERRRNVLGNNKRYVFDAAAAINLPPPMAGLPALVKCPVR